MSDGVRSAAVGPALALTAAEVAELLGYRHRNGLPNGDLVRQLYRSDRFPEPIDPALPVRQWRWSLVRVEAYVAGGSR